jgi:AcrR family transcriptional regulator
MPDNAVTKRRGRPPAIGREDIIRAALSLLGPQRSVATLTLREVARAAGIAPNSFYRHFPDIDALAVCLIERAGSTLRRIIGDARRSLERPDSVVRMSMEIFIEQLDADDGFLPLLLREGHVGSDAFKQAVEAQLCHFEDELQQDLLRLSAAHGFVVDHPALAARAITRLVFVMGTQALDQPPAQRRQLVEQSVVMLRMIIDGAQRPQTQAAALP